MEFAKKIALFVIAGVVVFGVIAACVAWFSAAPADRAAVLSGIGRVAAAMGIAFLLPWLTFFFSTAAARQASNAAGIAVVAGYTIVDAALLAWALRFSFSTTTAIVMAVFGVLLLATYNLVTCDWIAERVH